MTHPRAIPFDASAMSAGGLARVLAATGLDRGPTDADARAEADAERAIQRDLSRIVAAVADAIGVAGEAIRQRADRGRTAACARQAVVLVALRRGHTLMAAGRGLDRSFDAVKRLRRQAEQCPDARELADTVADELRHVPSPAREQT